METDKSQAWVELPDCDAEGADSSKPLLADLTNASWATCKPAKRGTKDTGIPIKSLAQKNNNVTNEVLPKEAGKSIIIDLNKSAAKW